MGLNKYGLILHNLRNSQLNYLGINQANRYRNAVIFYMEESPPCTPITVCTMHVHEIWNFKGTLIATNLNSAELCLNKGGDHIFYINELEWMHGNGDYFKNHSIYNKMRLVTRSDKYADYVENYCNKRPSINKFLDLWSL